MVTDFGANQQKLTYPTFILLAFHGGWEDHNMGLHMINTADDLSTTLRVIKIW